jgi:uncharacterized membrane protein
MFLCSQLDGPYFPMGEREALARTIIRKHDKEHLYHCAKQHCGELCPFRAVTCSNTDCHVVISACWEDKHDKTCPKKIVPCDRVCGESMARMSLENHKEHSCPLRYSLVYSEIYFHLSPRHFSPFHFSPSSQLHLCLSQLHPIFLFCHKCTSKCQSATAA